MWGSTTKIPVVLLSELNFDRTGLERKTKNAIGIYLHGNEPPVSGRDFKLLGQTDVPSSNVEFVPRSGAGAVRHFEKQLSRYSITKS